MTVYTFDPLEDSRWGEFISRHPAASVFHTPAFVQALKQTYGYRPVVYTTSPPGAPLDNGVLLCEVRSWLTGRRLVSVPFADHCEPLIARPSDRLAILSAIASAAAGLKYVELRRQTDASLGSPAFRPASSFAFHQLDLRCPLEEIYSGFHVDAIRRKIGRAGREGVTCMDGSMEDVLPAFYRLTIRTRRRHGIPPQPIEWFRNLVRCLGDRLKIHLAVKDGRAIGGLLTLRHRKTLVYKYGSSDERFHHFGTMPFLLWTAIQEAKSAGLETFDLGRSDLDNRGLIRFKERLGAVPSSITYFRWSHRPLRTGCRVHPPAYVMAHLPDRVLIAAGKLLYRHMG